MAKTARDVMSGGAECIGENDTVLDAAKRLAELNMRRWRSAARTTA
jgi:hypothetical protein